MPLAPTRPSAALPRALAAAKAAHIAAKHVATFGNCTHDACKTQYEALRALGWNGGYYA